MKTIVSISLESSDHDYEFQTPFLGQEFLIKRIGVDKDTKQAEALIRQWQNKADAIALEGLRDHQRVGTFELQQKLIKHLEGLSRETPVKIDKITGSAKDTLLGVKAIRHAQFPGGIQGQHHHAPDPGG